MGCVGACRETDEDAADLTQDVFISAFKAVQSFRMEAAFGTWLYRIAVNRCSKELRRFRPQERLWADVKANQISTTFDVPDFFDLDRDIVHPAVLRAAHNVGQSSEPQTPDDLVHDTTTTTRSMPSRKSCLACPRRGRKARPEAYATTFAT
jgi:hypothetical protein